VFPAAEDASSDSGDYGVSLFSSLVDMLSSFSQSAIPELRRRRSGLSFPLRVQIGSLA